MIKPSPTTERPSLSHAALAKAGPVRLTVDAAPRLVTKKDKSKVWVVDVTLLPKGEAAHPVALWCENQTTAEFLNKQERGVPFTVIAEGKGATALVTKVASTIKPPEDVPPPGPRSPDREPSARQTSRHAPAPHDTSKRNGPDAGKREHAAAEARVMLARKVTLKRLCIRATLALNEEAQAAGAPPMPPETFWQQVTNLFIGSEREGWARDLPVDLTFARIAEMAKRKPEPVNVPEQPPREGKPAEAAKTACAECGAELTADGVCSNGECKTNDDVPF